MGIVTDSDDSVDEAEEQKSVKFRPWKQNLSRMRKFLGHFGLFVALIVYTAGGAWVFQELEYGEEVNRTMALKHRLDDKRIEFQTTVLNYIYNAKSRPGNLNASVGNLVEDFVETLEDLRSEGLVSFLITDREHAGNLSQWREFTKSAFFASTVLTTIGYGDMAPYTRLGRGFCILFALIGIPFTLTVIADVGKLMASAVSMAAKRLRKTLFKSSHSRENSKWNKFGKTATVIAAVGLLLLYITLGGYLFTQFEDWDFFDSFYFCFITMTTIGLGDLVPSGTNYPLLCVYILIGLALTSTAIELVRLQYADSWRRMRELSNRFGPLADTIRKYGDNINLDVNVLQDLKDLKKVLAMSSGRPKREGSIWKKFWENEDGFDDDRDSTEPKLIQIIIYESSV